MNDPNTTTQTTEMIYRRLIDPVPFFRWELPPGIWIIVLAFVLLIGFFYIGWMYFKDSRGIGPWWSILLGLLRASVYLLLAWIFLLPGRQSVESATAHSKVILLWDASESMVVTVDDPPIAGVAFSKMKSRQDKVLDLLTSDMVNFIGRLVDKNPVTGYRFARGLDEDWRYFDKDHSWTRAERQAFEEQMRDPSKSKDAQPDAKPMSVAAWSEWLKPTIEGAVPPATQDEWTKEEKDRFTAQEEANKKLRDKAFFKGTNVSDSVQSALIKEMNGMVQGIVVFTDGRSTEGSDLVYDDLERRAKAANIPIFVVGIGEDRPVVKIEIVDTRGPALVQPEDTFKVVVDIDGIGLEDQEIEALLEVLNIRKTKDNKEEQLDITLTEPEDKANPGKKRQEINLGKSLKLQPEKKVKFDRSTPPHAEVEYVINATTLARAAGIDLSAGEFAKIKWEIGETKDSEMRVRQIVPKDRLEVFADKEHVGDPFDFRVLKRPVRVLLMASGPSHDFQFLNTLLIREVEKKRAEQTIYMQLPPGRSPGDRRMGVVLGVPAERLLNHFPNRLDKPVDDPNEKYYDLSEFDVVVAFDPDWNQLSDEELNTLGKWVDKGGGLVVLGGPINTVQLAKPGANKDKIKPILDLYPVVLKDVRIDELDRTTDRPWPLSFEGATPEMEFLKLDDNPDRPFLSDWDEFFYGKVIPKGEPKPPDVENGFFSYYPSEKVKVGAQVVARFMDPKAKMNDGYQMPYIVLTDPNSGRRVVWIANMETYRLRKHSESFHERFWAKLMRYAGAKNQGKVNKRISLNMSSKYKSNQFINLDARIDGPGGEPLPKSAKVKISIKLPLGADPKEVPTEIEMKPKPGNDANDAGKFTAKFQVKTPGDYSLELKVQNTSDTESRKFSVVEANPELDNTRPDFDRMYRMASEADSVLARMGPDDAAKLKKNLQRPKLTPAAPPKDGKDAKDVVVKDDKVRLYFNLNNAELIPTCMVPETKTKTMRGQIQDTWDGPLDLKPIGIDYQLKFWWLYVAVGLFSTEWLIRKLLRLA